jgi:7-cyano-7-deazaguanine reductase
LYNAIFTFDGGQRTNSGRIALITIYTVALMSSQPSKTLETFDNPKPERDFHIHMEIPEFTCLCPKTGQPDFAVLYLDYIPDQKCVELKSLKLYMWSFRDEGCFHEAVTNRILDDLVAATQPKFMRLTAKFYVRGGVFTNVVAEHRKPGWQPAPRVDLTQFDAQSNIRG